MLGKSLLWPSAALIVSTFMPASGEKANADKGTKAYGTRSAKPRTKTAKVAGGVMTEGQYPAHEARAFANLYRYLPNFAVLET